MKTNPVTEKIALMFKTVSLVVTSPADDHVFYPECIAFTSVGTRSNRRLLLFGFQFKYYVKSNTMFNMNNTDQKGVITKRNRYLRPYVL